MKSEIKNIRFVCKEGAYGNINALGRWIYGKRPGGKTVACKNKKTENGGVIIWSKYYSHLDDVVYDCETEFSKEEWQRISENFDNSYEQIRISNQILKSRED